jgi:hypothetical protein
MRTKRMFISSIVDRVAQKACFGGANSEKLCKRLKDNDPYKKIMNKKASFLDRVSR